MGSSSYHQYIGEVLARHFSLHKLFEEYPVQEICPSWHSGKHKFDWVILDLQVVIEVHGEQHYSETVWGKEISTEEAKANLITRQHVDWQKAEAARAAGFVYVAISYKDIKEHKYNTKTTAQWLSNRIMKTQEEGLSNSFPPEIIKKRKPVSSKEFLKKQKEFRHRQYLRWKQQQQQKP